MLGRSCFVWRLACLALPFLALPCLAVPGLAIEFERQFDREQRGETTRSLLGGGESSSVEGRVLVLFAVYLLLLCSLCCPLRPRGRHSLFVGRCRSCLC